MSVQSKMTAIADAIREKTGGTAALTLDRMATEIQGIEAGGGGSALQIDHENYGVYAAMVTVGANSVANAAQLVTYFCEAIGADSIHGAALQETEYTANNQFIVYTNGNSGYRYRGGVVGVFSWNGSAYDTVLVEGTTYLVTGFRAYTA